LDLRRALIAAACLAAAIAAAQPARALQQRVKAAFLTKFPAYVDWPAAAFATPSSPIVIGVAGDDDIARELDAAAAGREVAERPLRVQRLAPGEPDNGCCHILFVGAGADQAARRQLGAAQGRAVLTVTDSPGAHPEGSVINFRVVEDRMRFDISREAADRNGLQLRAQLLAVARQVTSP
jgi:hypothetical protein